MPRTVGSPAVYVTAAPCGGPCGAPSHRARRGRPGLARPRDPSEDAPGVGAGPRLPGGGRLVIGVRR